MISSIQAARFGSGPHAAEQLEQELSPALPGADPAKEPAPVNPQLQQVAREFEAVFTAAMIKEGLRSAMKTGMGEEDGQGTSTYMDMTCQQLADFLGRQGLMGIADNIVAQLANKQPGNHYANH